MGNILIQNITTDQLKTILEEAICKELDRREREKPQIEQDLLMSPQACAELLSCHRNSIMKYIRTGILPAERLGSKILIRKSAALSALKNIQVIKHSRNRY